MLRTFTTFCFVLLVSTTLFAQKTINSYKYVIVPNLYEFQKSEDQYQINSLTKFLFEKEGFVVISSDEAFPKELANNRCSGLKAVLKNEKGFLSTNISIKLTDCFNVVIYASPVGKSKIKDYKKAYHQAIRKAFVGIQELEYKYDGSAIEVETAPAAALTVAPVVAPKQEVVTPNKVVKAYSIEGKYFIDMWGECVISKKGNGYAVIGGDENYEFAEVSSTSKPTIFMMKKTGFKQTQMLEIDENGNLKIDSKSGVKIYKRIN